MMVKTTGIHFMYLPAGEPLLCVRPGLPAEVALEKASCVLASVIAVARSARDDDDADLAAVIPDLAELAKGIVDSVLESI